MIKFETVVKREITVEEGTVGGRTYTVRLPNEKEPRPLCFRRIASNKEMRCTNPAGYKTSHNGTGACAYHGGAATEAVALSNITSGKYSVATRSRLNGQVQRYLNMDRSQLLDLTEQLAFGKAVFDEFVEKYPTPDDVNYGMWLSRFQNMLGSLGSLVEKMSRIDTRNTLTAAQVMYLRATVADLLMKYLKDPYERERAAKELASRLGGEVSDNVEMRPSEIVSEVL